MATFDNLGEAVRSGVEILRSAPTGWAIVAAGPLALMLLTRFFSQYANATEGDAVFLVSAMAGIFGFLAQALANEKFKRLDTPINGGAVIVPMAGILLMTLVVMWTFLPPSSLATEVVEGIRGIGLA